MQHAPMSNLAPEPTTLRMWIAHVQKRRHTLRFDLSNGSQREGRVMSLLDDFVMLAPASPGGQARVVALAHVVAIDVVEDAK